MAVPAHFHFSISQLFGDGIEHDRFFVEFRVLRLVQLIFAEDILVYAGFVPTSVCVIAIDGVFVPGNSTRRILMFVNTAQRMSKLMDDDARKLLLVSILR